MTRILVCDDNPEDLNRISAIAGDFYNGVGAGAIAAPHTLVQFANPSAALDYAEASRNIDIAVLDIIMPGMTGMELAEQLRAMEFDGYIVFLTSSNDYAAQSYAAKAFSYILKPIGRKEVYDVLSAIEKKRKENECNGFSLTRKSGVRFVLYSELMYVEVMKHDLFFYLTDGEIIKGYGTLREYTETLLSEPRMIKPQRSFIVNMDYIQSCDGKTILMRNGTRISVPSDFKTVKLKWLERMFGQGSW
jgi:DNA-binding LytR/AlgR family response regulator